MSILYLHQHFALPSGSTGTRSYEFAKRWVKAGHKVTVICGHYDLGGLEYTRESQIIDGIKVLIVGTKYSNKMRFIKRVFSFLSFMFFAFIAGLKQKNVDVIFATSTPLTIGIPAILLKWFKKKPFVFEVRDEWPRIPVEMGIIKNKVLIKFLYWLERFIYKQSSGIVALSPGMADGVRDIIGDSKSITIASNSSDLDVFHPDIDGSTIRKERGWKDKFILLHFGAMGKANGLGFVVDAAEKLAGNQDIHFVLVGEGSEKQKLKDMITKAVPVNIEVFDSVPKSKLPLLVAAADVSMVIFANYPVLEHNSANKFFDSLSAGKPVLLNYSGWQRCLIEQYNIGYGCEICDLDQFIENIYKLYDEKENLNEMGKNARRLAESQFSRDVLAEKVLKVLENIVHNYNNGKTFVRG